MSSNNLTKSNNVSELLRTWKEMEGDSRAIGMTAKAPLEWKEPNKSEQNLPRCHNTLL